MRSIGKKLVIKTDLTPKFQLVTGGAGFIGSHVVDALIETGENVIVLDDLSTGKKEYVSQQAQPKWISLSDRKAVVDILAKYQPTVIHHCAGHTKLREALAAPADDAQQNIICTLNLLQAILELQQTIGYLPEQILFSSSSSVYGGYTTPPYSEHLQSYPVTPYGIAKSATEQYLLWFYEATGVPVTMFRYANVYGPRQSSSGETGVIAKFMHALVTQTPLVVYGDGTHQRDYVFVGDVAQAHLAAVQSKCHGIYNIGTGIPTSTLELAKLCQGLSPEIAPTQLTSHLEAVNEQSLSWLDTKKFSSITGWKPQNALSEGVKQTFEWYCTYSREV